VRLSETHLIILMCEPHTIRTQAVSISDSMLAHKYMHECTSVMLKNAIIIAVPLPTPPSGCNYPYPTIMCSEGTSSHLSLGGGGIPSGSPWSLEQDQLQNILFTMSAIYTHSPTPAHICPKGRHEPAQVLTIKSLECSTPTVHWGRDFEERVARCSSQEIYHFCFYCEQQLN